MRPFRSFSTAEIAGLPATFWVRAELHTEAVRRLEREMSLMFSAEEHLDLVRARDRAEDLADFYSKTLKTIAAAAGWELDGKPETIEKLTAAVARRLLEARLAQRPLQAPGMKGER